MSSRPYMTAWWSGVAPRPRTPPFGRHAVFRWRPTSPPAATMSLKTLRSPAHAAWCSSDRPIEPSRGRAASVTQPSGHTMFGSAPRRSRRSTSVKSRAPTACHMASPRGSKPVAAPGRRRRRRRGVGGGGGGGGGRGCRAAVMAAVRANSSPSERSAASTDAAARSARHRRRLRRARRRHLALTQVGTHLLLRRGDGGRRRGVRRHHRRGFGRRAAPAVERPPPAARAEVVVRVVRGGGADGGELARFARVPLQVVHAEHALDRVAALVLPVRLRLPDRRAVLAEHLAAVAVVGAVRWHGREWNENLTVDPLLIGAFVSHDSASW